MSHIKYRVTRNLSEFHSLIKDYFDEAKSIDPNNNSEPKILTHKEWKEQISDHEYNNMTPDHNASSENLFCQINKDSEASFKKLNDIEKILAIKYIKSIYKVERVHVGERMYIEFSVANIMGARE